MGMPLCRIKSGGLRALRRDHADALAGAPPAVDEDAQIGYLAHRCHASISFAVLREGHRPPPRLVARADFKHPGGPAPRLPAALAPGWRECHSAGRPLGRPAVRTGCNTRVSTCVMRGV